ncbi:MAG: hypothetical protein ACLFP2_00495 [Candidatus Woesearchaeota archaeon]
MKKGISISINFIIIAIVAMAVLVVILFIFGDKARVFTEATDSKDCSSEDYEKAIDGECEGKIEIIQLKEPYDGHDEGAYVRCCVE